MNHRVFTYVRCCLINALHISFFPGQLKLLQESTCEEGGSEEEYTSLFNKKLSWESRILAFLACDFRLGDKQIVIETLPKCRMLVLKNKFQSFEWFFWSSVLPR